MISESSVKLAKEWFFTLTLTNKSARLGKKSRSKEAKSSLCSFE
jgi:hypothetical protein